MSNYRKLSRDEINEAAETDLVDFLSSRGEKVEKRGSNYFWTGGGHNSLALFGRNNNLFKHFASGETGNAIQFCREYLNMSFQEAVESLLGTNFSHAPSINPGPRPSISPSSQDPQPGHSKEKPSKTDLARERPLFTPPEKADGVKDLYKYLSDQRRLDKAVIWEFIDADSLYQTKETSKTTGKHYSNIAFIAKDFDGVPQGAIKRSFTPSGFKGNHPNSNMREYCFRYDGISRMDIQGNRRINEQDSKRSNGSRLFVFEAPIDMLSYITLLLHH